MVNVYDEKPKDIRRLAILDDDPDIAEAASWDVEAAGFEPVVISEQNQTIKHLLDYMLQNAEGAICDHRLSPHGMANFYGASVVAELYDRKFPAILVTQYIDIDVDVSIRRWRHKIPVLLSRDDTNARTIRDGIMTCSAELSGKIPDGRRPHRVLLDIVGMSEEANEVVLDVIIAGWNPRRAVRIPGSLIPESMHAHLVVGLHLIAQVNIGAERPEALYFRDFEEAIPPEDSDGLA